LATFTKHHGLRATAVFAVGALMLATLSGCARLTSIDAQGQVGGFQTSFRVDPPTLNPPQQGTLTLGLTNATTKKPVTDFETVSGALMHAVLISRDLKYFHHTYTDNLVVDETASPKTYEASLPTYFPVFGRYYAYMLFKPASAPVQVFKATISTGDVEGPAPQLVEDSSPVKTVGWLTFELLKETNPIKSGRPTQLVFNVSERGNQVTTLWPYLDAPGQLWIVDENGANFAHLVGASEARGLPPAGAGNAEATASPTEETGGATATAQPIPTYAPTFAPGVINAMGTVGVPHQQLVPVQQTALASIMSTPESFPTIGYGPNVAFTHTFPHAGLYKCWLEVYYRGQVVVADYVLNVSQ
jgi:hypothetical protein